MAGQVDDPLVEQRIEWRRYWWTRQLEISYPRKFSPIYPVDQHIMPPRYPWGRDSFPEALFQGKHMAYEVRSVNLSENASQLSNEAPERRTLSVPITHLSHCTHNKEARLIEDKDEYRCFTARRKEPRRYTHVYNIEERTTEPIQHSVLPGYLSWWGISTIEWYNSDDPRGIETKERVSTLPQWDQETNERIFVPPYLQYCDGQGNSVYGGNSFSCPIRNLIESYQESRYGVGQKHPIYFKKAGTLRYKHEICYVILVCIKEDLQNEDISSMPGAGQPDTNMGRNATYFNLGDEFITPDGELLQMEITPKFISEYPIRAIYTGPQRGKFYSWDTLNFAFYFPNGQGQLKVESQYITRADIQHDGGSCHLGDGNCPDRENA